MSKKINVVGFDAAFANFGIAHATVDLDTHDVEVEHLNLIETKADKSKTVRKNSDDMRRASLVHKAMLEACEGKAVAFAEVPTGSQSARASWSLGIAVGLLAACPLRIIELSPSEVKLNSVGIKTATKQEMIDWAVREYPNANWLMRKSKGVMVPKNANEHLADAVAVIRAGVQNPQFQQLMELMKAVA